MRGVSSKRVCNLLEGQRKVPRQQRHITYENRGGIILVQANKQSFFSSSISEMYFVDKLCWWFVNYFCSEN